MEEGGNGCFGRRYDVLAEICMECSRVVACKDAKNNKSVSLEKRQEYAAAVHTLVTKLISLKENIITGYLETGRILKSIRDEKLFVYMGDHIRNIADVGTEIGYKKSMVYNFISIYEKFGSTLEKNPALKCVEHSRLVRLLPIVKPEDTEEWLSKAKDLPNTAFEDSIKSHQGKKTTDTCGHEGKRETYEKCVDCGKWIKVD